MFDQAERSVKGVPEALPTKQAGLCPDRTLGRGSGSTSSLKGGEQATRPGRAARMVPVTSVYLEAGPKRVFACAVDWPGWCRSGRGEEQALAALATAASRYAVVPALAGVAFDPVHEVDCIEIAERVTGTSVTDFGALDVAPAVDGEPGTEKQAERLGALVET